MIDATRFDPDRHRRSAVMRFSLLATLVVACREGALARLTAPATPASAVAMPTRPAAPVAPDDAADPPPATREDTSFEGVSRYYLREGTFPTREQTFRPGLVIEC